MRSCTVEVCGIEFRMRYTDFLYDLVLAITANTGLNVVSVCWNGGEKYIATIRGGELLPVVISNDRRVSGMRR